ncbi:carbohydrate esterase family 9 protein [Pseudocercospora fijiensis CIRAD86]|uniref:N-acetylglucosamine-6-phosphate deacetylase n=1 Tax=Pseudocercospora fijiensis (strain CIRAD86) TaxID=383855 RepID=M3AIG2_PSEFD|nr:carbohydrate esterase family 9 protein [Pseudocercospora fijiensis CIRAD86]EME77242.1 carbohydrate esterase family 9 protein [Pseudocercospora fijiensis CIRAD86]
MPIAVSPERPRTGVTRLTGGRLVKGDKLIEHDLWISSVTGKILHDQEVFYEHHVTPDEIIDLEGKILCPGFIDVQFNGAFGYDFSTIPEDGMEGYVKGLRKLNRHLIKTGVTSYLPTIPSNNPEIYQKTLPHLRPSGDSRNPLEGSESLGAHVEGPFISPTKNGIHSHDVLRTASNGFGDIEACYGSENLPLGSRGPITKITAAPEVEGVAQLIPEFTRRGIIFSVGHTEATYEDVTNAVRSGATMITHLFNAMRPLHHRNPGPFGVLGKAEETERPYFGVISDGIHLHPTTVKIAYNAHKDGFIIVTDAMKTVGQPDGVYEWTNGDRFIKKGSVLTLEGTDRLAGSCATLVENVSNFWTWSRASIPEVIKAVTYTPAKMLGIERAKGTIEADADADLLVLDPIEEADGQKRFEVEQVWKFGSLVFDRQREIVGYESRC